MTILRTLTIVIRWLAILFVVAAILYAVPLNMAVRKTSDIDVNSGRLRTRWYVLFFPCRARVQETIVSQYIGNDKQATADWRRVGIEPMELPRFIPHTKIHITPKYGDVPTQMKILQLLWNQGSYSLRAKQETASKLLSAWKIAGNDKEGAVFLNSLSSPSANQ